MTVTDRDRLEHMLLARHPAVLIVTTEEDDARALVRNVAQRLRREIFEWSAVHGLRDVTDDQYPREVEGTENPAAACFHVLRIAHSDMLFFAFDLSGHLSDATVLRAWRDLVRRMRDLVTTAILIDHTDELPDIVKAEATRFELTLPDEGEIEQIVTKTLRTLHRERKLDVRLTKRNLQTIVRNLIGLSRRHCEQIIAETVADDRKLDPTDINHILARKRQLFHQGGVLDYVEAPVDLSEIGGLHQLKEWLARRKSAFSDDAVEFGLAPPRGVLMLGVQGAGKSLCAKAIATAWQRPLLRLDPGSLYDRYVGESERRLREALHQAEMMSPIVLWIDEIEKGFASAASRSTDGGLSQRMFGTLLTWMQEHDAPVFLVATANDIEALPPELLRKGRFDEIFFVDLPDRDTRRGIFAIHLKKRDRDADQFDLDRLAEESDGYSGAEIEQAVISGLHEAFARKKKLTTEMLVDALRNSPPLSVTMREKVAALRAWAEGRCVPAG